MNDEARTEVRCRRNASAAQWRCARRSPRLLPSAMATRQSDEAVVRRYGGRGGRGNYSIHRTALPATSSNTKTLMPTVSTMARPNFSEVRISSVLPRNAEIKYSARLRAGHERPVYDVLADRHVKVADDHEGQRVRAGPSR